MAASLMAALKGLPVDLGRVHVVPVQVAAKVAGVESLFLQMHT